MGKHDLKTIAEEPTADEEHDAFVDKFEPTLDKAAYAPQETKTACCSVTVEPDASMGHVPREVLKLNPLSVPPLNDAEILVDAKVIDQLEVDKPCASAPEQGPAKAQRRSA